ncbi:MAG: sapC family protein [Alphaproteobacteria bacterium]|nr:sapC family protein [Alphaproteobacteria bacterium]HCQ70773.1 sapC family protein [Rhodospirillaceae bacterium]|tara:strand:+ start:8828 stop:9616 length:789 start_codon:yes stop_codon:yes gene_type:complete
MAKSKETENKEEAKGASSAFPLFYSEPRPLDSEAHKTLALKEGLGFGFTDKVNAVPVNLVEMPQICHHYPIAFSPDANATPVAILGLRDGENLFVDKEGKWAEGAYIPAYIRRYPFIFSEVPESDQLTLCIDFKEGETVQEGGDKKFFDDEGKATALASNALEFCKSYHAAAQRTAEFSKELLAKDLLIERQAQIQVGSDVRINFSGFKIVDEKKLAELDDATFLEWRKKGWLPFLYAHLFSGVQWQSLSGALSKILEAEKA